MPADHDEKQILKDLTFIIGYADDAQDKRLTLLEFVKMHRDQVFDLGRAQGREEVKDLTYMYTHQWPGNDEKRVCETCGEVVEKWTPCEMSKSLATPLVKDILDFVALTPQAEKLDDKPTAQSCSHRWYQDINVGGKEICGWCGEQRNERKKL